ncbi:UNVERIFIED_CONTAM: LEAF RUST 10 DISEASE-RESISTANCE LOCUS RECEPTOR-LIKE PROTEIN KINASE-like 2.1 [Sesamum radiatum]|uniref:LEAF RUST 10 DISEASE-RESISTANCE LOCUS RECEPTOR-LIKE PROTEIN KINASE-like 2.1 n=1 Tax=Sesamum radiatum TaxID=300843 RepID=A0AAW2V3U8_SESRA
MEWKPKQELFLFLVATLLPLNFPSFYCKSNQHILPNCSRSFQCGGIGNIRYPFWVDGVQPEECGHSGFQLFNCEGAFPVLDIQPLRYHILELNFSTRTLKVAREDLLKNACPQVLPILMTRTSLSSSAASAFVRTGRKPTFPISSPA